MWKKKGESLKRHCTVKGKKESVSEHIVYFNVAVVHDKGVLRCLLCFKISILKHVNLANYSFKIVTLLKTVKLHVAVDSVGCRLFKIPPHSPDLNLIENIDYVIGKQPKKSCYDSKLGA